VFDIPTMPSTRMLLFAVRRPLALEVPVPDPGVLTLPGRKSSKRSKLRPFKGSSTIDWLLTVPPSTASVVLIVAPFERISFRVRIGIEGTPSLNFGEKKASVEEPLRPSSVSLCSEGTQADMELPRMSRRSGWFENTSPQIDAAAGFPSRQDLHSKLFLVFCCGGFFGDGLVIVNRL
jgi:hypothetical protein